MSEKTEAMTAERIAEIKAREGKATPGPWVAHEKGYDVVLGYEPEHDRTDGYGCGNDFVCDLNDGEYHEYSNEEEQRANAEFIAAARQDIPDLLAEVERLQRVARYLAAKLSTFSSFGKKFIGATLDDGYGNALFDNKEVAVQSWIDEAEREVGNERN